VAANNTPVSCALKDKPGATATRLATSLTSVNRPPPQLPRWEHIRMLSQEESYNTSPEDSIYYEKFYYI